MTTTRIRRAGSAKTGEWTTDPGFGVYVHIPFCLHRCHYCDFNTYEGQNSLHRPYVGALVNHIETLDAGTPLRRGTSVFFGGGTPTLLAPDDLGRILDAVGDRIGIEPDAEITVEANPETVDEGTFDQLLAAGFNRVSIGVQSLVPRVLLGLGRTHSEDVALAAIAAARRAGVPEINADLIYGSPWETEADWATSLAGVIDANPDHISAYALTVESGTPLATLVSTGRVPDVDPDVQAERHGVASNALASAGYHRYEVSNWARPGHVSRHNVLYWCGGDYLGVGAGAHGHIAGRRYWSVRLPRDFTARVDAGLPVEEGSELLDGARRAGEALMLGLRLSSGVDLDEFAKAYGRDAVDERLPAINDLIAKGLLEARGKFVRVPDERVLLTNEVAAAVL